MAFEWQTQIHWSKTTGLTIQTYDTDWCYPNSVTSDESDYPIFSNFDDPVTGNELITMYWNDLNNILLDDENKYATYFNINSFGYWKQSVDGYGIISFTGTTKKEDSTTLIVYNFGLNVPNGSTIENIKVKIVRESVPLHDASSDPNWTNVDREFFLKNITTYTHDAFIGLDTTANTSISSAITNKSQSYTEEIITLEPGVFDEQLNNGYNVKRPTGVWLPNQKETAIYSDNTWRSDGTSYWTPELLNDSSFCVKIKANQHIFRSYTQAIPINGNSDIFYNDTEKQNWMNNKYSYPNNYNTNQFGFLLSKIYSVAVKVTYSLSGSSYTMIDENSFPIDKTLYYDDVYFKYNKCFNGICYSYIKDINDIYNISLLTGDGYSINNLYNEYNIIRKYISNLYHVDIATGVNVDLTSNHFKIDDEIVKEGHLILLMGQDDPKENDIYRADSNSYLINSNFLTTRESSWRAKCDVKLGSNKEKQFFLMNVGNQFPITGETKTWEEYHSYILKHYIDYNMYNTATATTYDSSGNTISTPCKLLFTDYELARTLTDERTTWNPININLSSTTLLTDLNLDLPDYFGGLITLDLNSYPLDVDLIDDIVYGSNIINIKYLDTNYFISDTLGGLQYQKIGTDINPTMFNWSGHTYFESDSVFCSESNIGDHVLISIITGTTDVIPIDLTVYAYINYYTTIKETGYTYTVINGEIPQWIFNDLNNNTGYTFRILNLHFSPSGASNMCDYINQSPYGKLLEATPIDSKNLRISNKISDYYKYFDYSLITIDHVISGETFAALEYIFSNTNRYADFELNTFLSELGTVPDIIYNQNYLSGNQYIIQEVYYGDLLYNHTLGELDDWYKIQSSMYKIIPTTTDAINKLQDFKAYTYIDFGTLDLSSYPYIINGAITGRTMIYEVTDTYMLIEKPSITFTGSTIGLSSYTAIYDILNVNRLEDISNILMDVYTNYTHDYYIQKPDNIRRKICSAYALIVKENWLIREISTGILYQEDDRFALDIFKFDANQDFHHQDLNLTYQPIELIDVGIDRITKLPIELELENLYTSSAETYWYYTGNTYYVGEEFRLINTTRYDDRIYFNGKWGGVLDFYGITTPSIPYIDRTSAVLIFNTGGTPLDFTWDRFDPTGTHYPTKNIRYIKAVPSGNTYHVGYCTQTAQLTSNINFGRPSSTMDSVTSITDKWNREMGIVLRMNDTQDIVTAASFYSPGPYNTGYYVKVNDILPKDYNYLVLQSKYDYRIFFNNDSSSTFYNAYLSNNQKYSGLLSKFSTDLKTNVWNTIIVSSTQPVGTPVDDIVKESNAGFLHIIEKTNTLEFLNENYGFATYYVNDNAFFISQNIIGYQYDYFISGKTGYDTIGIALVKLDGGQFVGSSIIHALNGLWTMDKLIYDGEFLYLLGSFQDHIIVDDITYYTHGADYDIFLVKMDSSGNIQWFKTFGGNNQDTATDIQYYDGYIYMTGYFEGTTIIGSCPLSTPGYVGSYVAKIKTDDGVVYDVYQKYSTEELKIKSINIVSDDNILIAGEFKGYVNFGTTEEYSDHYQLFIEKIKL